MLERAGFGHRVVAQQGEAIEGQMVFDEAIGIDEVGIVAGGVDPEGGVDVGARDFGLGAGGGGARGVDRGAEFDDGVERADPEAEIVGDEAAAIDVVGPVAIMVRLARQAIGA